MNNNNFKITLKKGKIWDSSFKMLNICAWKSFILNHINISVKVISQSKELESFVVDSIDWEFLSLELLRIITDFSSSYDFTKMVNYTWSCNRGIYFIFQSPPGETQKFFYVNYTPLDLFISIPFIKYFIKDYIEEADLFMFSWVQRNEAFGLISKLLNR